MDNKLTHSEVQKIVIEMLYDVSVFASNNRLHPVLLGGTLLGSVRDGGMISWDDDLDIGLKRSEYNWFMEHYISENKQFVLMKEDNINNFVPYMRLVDTDTVAVSDYYEQRHGVFIDIFPIDYFNKTELQTNAFFFKQKALKIFRNIVRSTGFYPVGTKFKFIKEIIRRVSLNVSAHSIALLQIKTAIKFSGKAGIPNQAGALNGFYGRKEIFPISVWEHLEEVVFEGSNVWRTKEFDTVLTKMYGQWKIPKEDTRNHGSFYWK